MKLMLAYCFGSGQPSTQVSGVSGCLIGLQIVWFLQFHREGIEM
jgi:hypothetical protein